MTYIAPGSRLLSEITITVSRTFKVGETINHPIYREGVIVRLGAGPDNTRVAAVVFGQDEEVSYVNLQEIY